ncbi:hypothetical protein BpHYR1_036041 [Brachionus plicatilis]|uniref:Uncharacterized protein n=1 Tax=Brachionus plicatilis TaxID=10195 RepID=A0A3M7RZH9_BRAPC|nr:hypothetical protein BpHYR1_036041 [Brachionus plicatilis]
MTKNNYLTIIYYYSTGYHLSNEINIPFLRFLEWSYRRFDKKKICIILFCFNYIKLKRRTCSIMYGSRIIVKPLCLNFMASFLQKCLLFPNVNKAFFN